jgi:ATP-binding protein involved in chromosome partitioning
VADQHAITAAVEAVVEPALRRSLGDLGMVERVEVGPSGETRVGLQLPTPHWPVEPLGRAIGEAARSAGAAGEVDVDVAFMDGSRQAEVAARQRSGVPSRPGGAGSRTRVITVASGKGGVGKSSVTANVAVALAASGHDVAVIDADVWGYSIPKMLGIDDPPSVIDQTILPSAAHGVRAISMDFFVAPDQAVVWRGPMLHKALEQFLDDVFWDEPEFLLLDLPPGTGDVAISLSQFLPGAQTVVVTTPQITAQRVAKRAALMAQKVNQEVVGVVENMSWFTGDDGTRYPIFGSGGGEALAGELGVPLLGQIPLVAALREGADRGEPAGVAAPGSEVAGAFDALAERLVATRPRVRRPPELIIE